LPALPGLLRFAAPLVLLAAFTSMNSVLDRYLLLHLLGLEAVAVYAAAVSLASVPVVFYSVLGFTLFPVLARHWGERKLDEVTRLMSLALRVYLFLGLPVALVIALAGPWGLPLLTTSHYRAAPELFALLGLSVVAFGIYQILLYALLLDGRSLQVFALAVVSTAINLLLNLLLAPRFGASGAAAAAVASNLVMALAAARLAGALLPWRFPWAGALQIVWRAAVAVLPLAWAGQQAEPSGMTMFAALAGGATLYLWLDRISPGSIVRSMRST
jgi:O-antigen/teichoic acid export membrane protein